MKRVIGTFGSLLGMWFPGLALLAASPPLGWEAVGGREPLSLFALESSRPGSNLPNEALLLTDYPCPGNSLFVELRQAPLPDEARPPPRGSVACVLPRADGRASRAKIMDRQGRVLREPELVAAILSNWRFEARQNPTVRPGWQRIWLDGLMVHEAPFTL